MTQSAVKVAHLHSQELQSLLTRLRAEYELARAKKLSLDMTRGKPAPEQLDIANELLTLPNGHHVSAAKEDARNYGNLQGLAEVRALFTNMLGAPAEQIVIANNSSLALMHDTLLWALLKGVAGSTTPWSQTPGTPAFLTPVPGYDRHFAICEDFGIRMIPVPLTGRGPDMDKLEALVADPSIKGIWCVPKYSNPTGEVYSDETVRRLASMKTGAADFRIFWDNAYALHHLSANPPQLANILEACAAAGNPDRAFVFASTSKITFAGSGLAFFASSPANVKWFLARAGKQTIGPDKLNQLRHLHFLKNDENLRAHMEGHRALLAPKFEAVIAALEARLGGCGVANWTRPQGGYFISVDVMDGTARRVVDLAREAGVALTPAGATWPHGRDPYDRTLRLAPSYPSLNDVKSASEVIALCILLAATEKHASTPAAH
jgi:DNA-binding transcriptional MocR family regulator